MRACERKCGARVTTLRPPPPAPAPVGSVQHRAWVRVGWIGSQATLFSSLSDPARLAQLLPSDDPTGWITRSLPSKPGEAGFLYPSGMAWPILPSLLESDHGLNPVWGRWLDGMARLLEDLTPARKEMALAS